MEFPKMLYKAGGDFEDHVALKAAIESGTVQTLIVKNAAEQKAAKGYVEELASLIKASTK